MLIIIIKVTFIAAYIIYILVILNINNNFILNIVCYYKFNYIVFTFLNFNFIIISLVKLIFILYYFFIIN